MDDTSITQLTEPLGHPSSLIGAQYAWSQGLLPLLTSCRYKSRDKLVFQVFPPRAYRQVWSQDLNLSEVPSSREKTAILLVSPQVVADVVGDRCRCGIP